MKVNLKKITLNLLTFFLVTQGKYFTNSIETNMFQT